MIKPMEENEIQSQIKDLPTWSWADDKLHKSIAFTDFREAMSFLIKLSFEIEQRDHHPEIYNSYNQVKISMATHDAGGKVTARDFELARAIDKLS